MQGLLPQAQVLPQVCLRSRLACHRAHKLASANLKQEHVTILRTLRTSFAVAPMLLGKRSVPGSIIQHYLCSSCTLVAFDKS
eukprot:7542936-Karenia_brevis.AAC.1